MYAKTGTNIRIRRAQQQVGVVFYVMRKENIYFVLKKKKTKMSKL